MIRFLCVSDIHGHQRALEAVLEEAKGRGFDQLVACGDLCFPGPDPLGVWETLTHHNALCVQGLGDRALARLDPADLKPESDAERQRVERLKQTRSALGELILARLARLPSEARLPLESGQEMLVVHGSPWNPTEPMTEDMSDDELAGLLGDQHADLVVCGASHVAFERMLGDVRIVNVGSVGEAPGGGYAHAAIVEAAQAGVKVTPFDVILD
jgi:predicted phosphodiesterase